MTFVIPIWLDSILGTLWIVFLVGLYIYLVAKVFKLFKIKLNQWLIGAIAILALIGTQLILENHYRIFYPQENDIVIKASGEIVENATNKKLITTDKDSLVYIGGGIPFQDTLPYSFKTNDGHSHDIQLLIYFQEAEIQTIMKAFQVYKGVVETHGNSPVYYFSSSSYYSEVVEEKYREEVSQQIGKVKRDDLTRERMGEIIETSQSQILNEYEKKLYTITLK
ncbi:hypothetical protein [Halalkalibacter akibai]|uniref:Uncharacterized protein n=1 Tax=Halalkalibacter akibai (strain ATCC 43226 / DSM 21942 / CIP 109018 / JCM 9157 / 1139) TaxID=1236973 RepID=W4R0P6_HALA3|nr:hypothetical protein [Halalkalibacter akibai]GAE37468.1 hypothetical protein JCM9157_4770 [Halalkalibacter akibai JCM 9157]